MEDIPSSDIPDEFLTQLSSFINDNDIKLIPKKQDTYDIVNMFLEKNHSEDPFLIVNLGDIIRQYQKWTTHLPLVKPFYAVKCNPDPVILNLLYNLGCNFDCASKNEIAKVINLGASPDRIIFANPCKMISQIKYARAHDVDLVVFDDENELYKIKMFHTNAKLVIRIKTDDSGSLCKFNSKFGADLEDVESLLMLAKSLRLNVMGISFHVGSGCRNKLQYKTAIEDCHRVYQIAKGLGIEIELINIGGGFPGNSIKNNYDCSSENKEIEFEEIAEVLNESIKKHFYDSENEKYIVEFIAEPGRFMVASSHTLVLSIINKKIRINKETKEKEIIYYVNDSIYSTLNNIIHDHFVITNQNLFPFNERNEKKYKSTIFGPTCDSLDKITDNIMLPDLLCGEYLYIENLGAYTTAVNYEEVLFNGFNKPSIHYIMN
jgi:ornithine decarboxylase